MMCDGHDTKSATLPPEIVLFLIDAPVPCELTPGCQLSSNTLSLTTAVTNEASTPWPA